MNNLLDKDFANALPSGVIVLDQQNQLLWWNALAEELLDMDLQALQHQHVSKIISANELKSLLQQKAGDLEIKIMKWAEFYLSLRLRPYGNNQSILILDDVTHLHRLEAMRSSFIANVSHELRTPLTVFHGYLETLLDNPAIDPQRVSDVLQQIYYQSQRMENIVEELLLLSQLETAAPDAETIHEFNVSDILQAICADAKSYSGDQQHQFVLELDKTMRLVGNVDELRSAFSNIIFNAVQYTPAKGTIKISCYDNDVNKVIKICDNGIGIPEKYIPRITQRFYRVDKSRSFRGKSGTGLGLAIVKHVLLRHQAELHINSQENRGSCFVCLFYKDQPNQLLS